MRLKLAARLFAAGIIPVIKIEDPDLAEPLGEALCNGGLPVAEITYRTDAAGEAIARLRSAFPDMLILAGTTLSIDQAKDALRRGAEGLVSPGLPGPLAAWCREQDVPFIPGACTPTEICAALDMGFTHLKFFPAGNYGGLETAKAFLSVFNAIRIMPTGGVDLDNAADYLQTPGILCCGGSFIAPPSTIALRDFSAIERTARRVHDLVASLHREPLTP